MQHCPHCQQRLRIKEQARLYHWTFYRCPVCGEQSEPVISQWVLHWAIGGVVGALVAYFGYAWAGRLILPAAAVAGVFVALVLLRFFSELEPVRRPTN